jgi:hypothetical protein
MESRVGKAEDAREVAPVGNFEKHGAGLGSVLVAGKATVRTVRRGWREAVFSFLHSVHGGDPGIIIGWTFPDGCTDQTMGPARLLHEDSISMPDNKCSNAFEAHRADTVRFVEDFFHRQSGSTDVRVETIGSEDLYCF